MVTFEFVNFGGSFNLEKNSYNVYTLMAFLVGV